MIQTLIRYGKRSLWALILLALVFIYEKGGLSNHMIIAVLVITFGIFLLIKLELNEEVPNEEYTSPNEPDAPPTPLFKPSFMRQDINIEKEPEPEFITKKSRFRRRSKSPISTKKITTNACEGCTTLPTLSLTEENTQSQQKTSRTKRIKFKKKESDSSTSEK